MASAAPWHAAAAAPTVGPGATRQQRLRAGGVQWQLTCGGQGPVLWLLHGTGASGASWRGVVPLLAMHHTVVVPDLPGHGHSSPLRGAGGMAGMAVALGELARALDLPPPQQLVGHSAGAALALRAVLDGRLGAPQRVLGLNAALLPFDGLAGRLFPTLARVLARQPLVPWLLAQRAKDASAVQRLVQATGSVLDDEGVALYGQLLRNRAHVAGALAMMADWDLHALWHDLPRLQVPLALAVGERDATVPPAQARAVQQRLPGTTLHSLGALGHLAHEEDPARVAALILG